MINEEVNRPILTVTSIAMDQNGPFVTTQNSPYPLVISVKVKNVGRSSAVIQETSIGFALSRKLPETCKEKLPILESSSTTVLPGMEGEFSQEATLSEGCLQEKELTAEINANVVYIDAGSGSKYRQHFSSIITFSPEKQRNAFIE